MQQPTDTAEAQLVALAAPVPSAAPPKQPMPRSAVCLVARLTRSGQKKDKKLAQSEEAVAKVAKVANAGISHKKHQVGPDVEKPMSNSE